MNEQTTDVSVSNDLEALAGGAAATPADVPASPQAGPASAPTNVFSTAPLLMDIKLPIRVRMGRTHLNLRAITQLGSGSVVELDCSVNDPVEIVVNDRVIAEGEVVVVAGNYGVRITRIAGANELGQPSTAESQLRSLSDRLK
jgi:flagellar motor switch protein FliN/FliY